MWTKLIYRGLPTSLLLLSAALLQGLAIRAFAEEPVPAAPVAAEHAPERA